jgi:hypothetical protein
MTTAGKARSWRDVLPVHPAADLFPLLEGQEFDDLVEDIRQHGLRLPIVLWHDVKGTGLTYLLDGRNRLRALIAIGDPTPNTPAFAQEDFTTVGHCEATRDPYALVVSMNLSRRHLTPEQKRELTVRLLKATPEKSDRQIARMVKRDHKTVAADRVDLERRGEIPHTETRTDTKGRKQATAKAAATRAKTKKIAETWKHAEAAAGKANAGIARKLAGLKAKTLDRGCTPEEAAAAQDAHARLAAKPPVQPYDPEFGPPPLPDKPEDWIDQRKHKAPPPPPSPASSPAPPVQARTASDGQVLAPAARKRRSPAQVKADREAAQRVNFMDHLRVVYPEIPEMIAEAINSCGYAVDDELVQAVREVADAWVKLADDLAKRAETAKANEATTKAIGRH